MRPLRRRLALDHRPMSRIPVPVEIHRDDHQIVRTRDRDIYTYESLYDEEDGGEQG